MVFSDPFFLFAFLPVALLLITAVAGRGHNYLILIFSLAFYYWTSGWLTLLLVASILVNWSVALLIANTGTAQGKKTILFAGLAYNLLALAWFKYAYFAYLNISAIIPVGGASLFEAIILPIGISFFTFQGISYLVDVWRGDVVPDKNPVRFGAYLSFFPQLIAGPIVRYSDVAKDFLKPRISVENLASGASRFTHGLLAARSNRAALSALPGAWRTSRSRPPRACP